MTEEEFMEHFKHTKTTDVVVGAGDSVTLSALMVQSGLRKTRADAKRTIKQNGL